jgi:hypothetical protein
MPFFNASRYLEASLQSVLHQTLHDIEVIVVDDGSTDASMEIVNSFDDPRIVIVHQSENKGLAASVNLAIGQAKAPFMARMDADDVSLPERLERQVIFLQDHPDISVVGTALQYMGYSNHLEHFPESPEDCAARLLFNVCVGHPSVVFRRSVFDRPENRYDPGLRQYSEEYDFWCRLAPSYRFANLSDPLVRYRTYPPEKKQEATELRRENSNRIRRKYLERLLGPVPEEAFATHLKLAQLDQIESSELADISRWLDHLLDMNDRRQALNQDALARQLAKRFFELCYVNAEAGREFFLQSRWSQEYIPPKNQRIRWRIKELVRR